MSGKGQKKQKKRQAREPREGQGRELVKCPGQCLEAGSGYMHDYLHCKKCDVERRPCQIGNCPCKRQGILIPTTITDKFIHQIPGHHTSHKVDIHRPAKARERVKAGLKRAEGERQRSEKRARDGDDADDKNPVDRSTNVDAFDEKKEEPVEGSSEAEEKEATDELLATFGSMSDEVISVSPSHENMDDGDSDALVPTFTTNDTDGLGAQGQTADGAPVATLTTNDADGLGSRKASTFPLNQELIGQELEASAKEISEIFSFGPGLELELSPSELPDQLNLQAAASARRAGATQRRVCDESDSLANGSFMIDPIPISFDLEISPSSIDEVLALFNDGFA